MSGQRITKRDLDGVVRRIERTFGYDPDAPQWDEEDDGAGARWSSVPGRFFIDGAYGGWALFRYVNEHGGVSDVLGVGHRPKRELYDLLHAFVRGLEFIDEVPSDVLADVLGRGAAS